MLDVSVIVPPAAAHTEALRHLWIKAKMVDEFLLAFISWAPTDIQKKKKKAEKQNPDY